MNLKKDILNMNIAKLNHNNKKWRYRKGDIVSDYTDESQLIKLIKSNILTEDIEINYSSFKKWYKIKDTIFAFYLKNK